MIRVWFLLSCLIFLLPTLAIAVDDDPPLTLLPPQGQTQAKQPSTNISNTNNEIHDIYGPIILSEPVPYLLLGGILASLVALMAFLFWYFKLRKKPALPPVPPWEKAKAELAAAKTHLNPKESIIYLEKASLVLRKYIESRFAIKSTKQTTHEFLTGLEFSTAKTPLHTYKNDLKKCLQLADMAKFAHHLVAQPELEEIEENIVQFVDKTTPSELDGGVKS